MRGVGKEAINQLLSCIVAIGGYLNLNVSFPCKTPYFRFRLLQLFQIGIVSKNRGSGVKLFLSVITAPIVLAQLIHFLIRRCHINRIFILQIRSATPIQDMNMSSPIYWRWRVISANTTGAVNVHIVGETCIMYYILNKRSGGIFDPPCYSSRQCLFLKL